MKSALKTFANCVYLLCVLHTVSWGTVEAFVWRRQWSGLVIAAEKTACIWEVQCIWKEIRSVFCVAVAFISLFLWMERASVPPIYLLSNHRRHMRHDFQWLLFTVANDQKVPDGLSASFWQGYSTIIVGMRQMILYGQTSSLVSLFLLHPEQNDGQCCQIKHFASEVFLQTF